MKGEGKNSRITAMQWPIQGQAFSSVAVWDLRNRRSLFKSLSGVGLMLVQYTERG